MVVGLKRSGAGVATAMAIAGLCIAACGGGPEASIATPEEAAAVETPPGDDLERPPSDEAGGSDGFGADPQSPADVPTDPPTEDAPKTVEPAIAHYIGTRTLIVRTSPDPASELRGAIPRGSAFAIYERVDGKGRCKGDGWAKVAAGAYVCLQKATETEREPQILPQLAEGRLVPYVYARPRHKSGVPDPVIPRFRSHRKMKEGEVHDFLLPHGTYAFVKRRGGIYYDRTRRAVPGDQLRRLRPSAFEGRDLSERPPPAPSSGRVLAWAVAGPTLVRETPDQEAKVLSRIEHHTEFEMVAGETIKRHGKHWRLHEGGYVLAKDVRIWSPAQRPEGIGARERWIDVDRSHQILTLYEGDEPMFTTLVSTGKRGDPTPRGTWRIYKKKAVDNMVSAPDEDEPYYVESVPWAQFFHEGYALHAAYWHNRFGRVNSHGCVNLSPKDAARVFAWTTPDVPEGWLAIHEPKPATGTLIRVR